MPKRSTLSLRQASARGALALLLAIVAAQASRAQAPAQKEAPASVSGRVREGERAMAGITVALVSTDPSQRFRAQARTKTDAEGRYSLTNVPPGRYQVVPYVPAYVVEGSGPDALLPGKPLTLTAGEEVADMDFRVERGGVITGRITDGDGNPVVGEFVYVTPADNTTPAVRRGPFEPMDSMTDDRGVYRIYGLRAGRYRVSVGQSREGVGAVSFGRRRLFRRTFYPDATEESQARPVEVKAGAEATDIDIALGRALKTYRASGRFVSAETGLPVPNVSVGFGPLDAAGHIGALDGSSTTGPRGEFQADGLAPGRYAVFAFPRPGEEAYSDLARFEVTDADVTGLVVQMKRGASVSGVVQIEGLGDRATAAQLLSRLRVFASVDTGESGTVPSFTPPPAIAPDGSFRVAGLRPGNLRLGVGGEARGLTMSRIELNGVPVKGGIPITEGAQVSGLRVVMVYGSGVIRGQVGFANGTPPQGARIFVMARRVGAPGETTGGRQAEADARGFFRLEGLTAGEYEVQARIFAPGPVFPSSERQHVSLSDGGEVNVSPVIDLSGMRGATPAPNNN